MAYSWPVFPASGTTNFEATARTALETWRSNSVLIETRLNDFYASALNQIAIGTTGLGPNTAVYGDSNITNHVFRGGKVGIGITSPGSKLGVAGAVVIGSTYASLAGPTNGLAVEGAVGIGTTTPSYNLQVYGNTASTVACGIKNISTSSSAYSALKFENSTSNAGWLFLNSTGATGYAGAGSFNIYTSSTTPIGICTNDVLRVFIGSDGKVAIGNNTTPGYQLTLSTDSAAKPSTSTWTVSSDERLKTDISLANIDRCYEIVKGIPLKRFGWKEGVYTEDQVKDRHKLGWIAQDVQKMFSKSVSVKPFTIKLNDGTAQVIEDCLDLNVDQIYAVLYGAVQKLISMVETLQANQDGR